MRIGIGYDIHPMTTGRKLVLAGLEIPHTKGLDGHSDADVLTHAVCDALLGAMGEGDIGTHFPASEPRYKGMSSHDGHDDARSSPRCSAGTARSAPRPVRRSGEDARSA